MLSSVRNQSMVSPLKRVIVKRPTDAFVDAATIERQWRGLGFLAPPDIARAEAEHERLVGLLRGAGAEVLCLPADGRTTLDSLYTHDPVLATDAGLVVLAMGKEPRRAEAAVVAEAARTWEVPVAATLHAPTRGEGGDMVWLDATTLLVGRGFRTNAAAVDALRRHFAARAEADGSRAVDVVEVPLPYGDGPDSVLHLMSLMSMVDDDLAVVSLPRLPVPLVELLRERGVTLVDIDEAEFQTQACNVLATRPRQVIMLHGNPRTRRSLEKAGCQVDEIDGLEIGFKGSGGPTCLTRPVLRALD